MPDPTYEAIATGTRGSLDLGSVENSSQPYIARNYLLVIAIDGYAEDPEHLKPLKNCVKDSEDLIRVLLENYEFEEEHVRFLYSLNQEYRADAGTTAMEGQIKARPYQHLKLGEATEENIFNAFRTLAAEIEAEQLAHPELKINLILYYAGHGIYDKFLDQGYWIPVDAKNGDYFKYIPNSIIQSFLSAVKTHHTFLISDSCFSGSLFASGSNRAVVSSRLEKDPSRWGLTAGRNEPVSDGSGENSPFAGALLSELKKEDVTTIGAQEICVKVLEKVAANDTQTPRGEPLRVPGHEGGQFVFRKKINANKHFETGILLMELAEYRPERAAYRAAEKQFALAVRLARKPADKGCYTLWQATALCAAAEQERAADLLLAQESAIEALLAEQGEREGIASEKHWRRLQDLVLDFFDTEISRMYKLGFGEESEGRGKIRRYEDTLERLHGQWARPGKEVSAVSGKRVAVLIGIDRYTYLAPLDGCVQDARKLGELLEKTFAYETQYLPDATRAAIDAAMQELVATLQSQDTLLVYLTGHSLLSPEGELLFLPADAGQAGEQAITGTQIDQWMQQIATAQKMLVLDLSHSGAMMPFAAASGYTLLAACAAHEQCYADRGGSGFFTQALREVLPELKNLQPGSIFEIAVALRERIAPRQKRQVPQFQHIEFFASEIQGKPRFDADFFRQFNRFLLGIPGDLSEAFLTRVAAYLQQNAPEDPELTWRLSRAYLGLECSGKGDAG